MDLLFKEILEREKLLHLWDEISSDLVDKLLADEFIEIGSFGQIYNKNDVIRQLSTQNNFEIVISNFSVKLLAKNIALATYKATKKSHFDSKLSLRSSIWKQIKGDWKIVFHQGTLI